MDGVKISERTIIHPQISSAEMEFLQERAQRKMALSLFEYIKTHPLPVAVNLVEKTTRQPSESGYMEYMYIIEAEISPIKTLDYFMYTPHVLPRRSWFRRWLDKIVSRIP